MWLYYTHIDKKCWNEFKWLVPLHHVISSVELHWSAIVPCSPNCVPPLCQESKLLRINVHADSIPRRHVYHHLCSEPMWFSISPWCWYAKLRLYMLVHGLDMDWVRCGSGCNQSDVRTCARARFQHTGRRGNWTKTLKGPNCWPLICRQVPCFGTEIRDTSRHANKREQERETEWDVNEVPRALGNGPLWLQDWTAWVRLILLLGGGNCCPKLSAEVWALVTLPGGNFSW